MKFPDAIRYLSEPRPGVEPTIGPLARLADASAAAACLALIVGLHLTAIFDRLEWVDWVAYALPAANLMRGSGLATPQLGTQCGFDRDWLFNSPLMGLGPVPFYATLGVGRGAYLVGCTTIDLLAVAVLFATLRRALGTRLLSPVAVACAGLVLNASYMSELYNQRYSTLAFAPLPLLFLPGPRGRAAPAWKWALAGALPLIHPSLLFGSVVWSGLEAASLAARRDRPRPAAVAAFAAGVLACVGWYCRPGPLLGQFLPQIRAVTGRYAWMDGWPVKLAFPMQATMALSVGIAATALVLRRGWAPGLSGPARAFVLMVLMLVLERLGRMTYLYYYLIGLLPCVATPIARTRLRRPMMAALMLVAAGVVVVQWGVNPKRPIWSTPADEARALIVRHTRPGDAIVLGAPFILASADRDLPEGRTVRYVVPQPYALGTFDEAEWLERIRAETTVYLGAPSQFKDLVYLRPSGVAIYEGSTSEWAEYHGAKILVARQVAGPPLPRPGAAGDVGTARTPID